MTETIKDDSWVWAVALVGGGEDQLLGQTDKETGISFIPIFHSKDDAMQCVRHLNIEKGRKFEIQAVIYEDLAEKARENGFLIFLLNDEGKVMQKRTP